MRQGNEDQLDSGNGVGFNGLVAVTTETGRSAHGGHRPSRTSVEAVLSFTRPEDVSPDREQRRRLRARTLDPDALLRTHSFDPHRCRVLDCSALDGFRPSLHTHGFTHADLSGDQALQTVLERVRAAGRVEESDATEIRRRLRGSTVRLADDRHMRLLFVAPEGFLMRTAGPNGLSTNGPITRGGMNDHDAAMAVHADQDVTGTPVKQILHRMAPWLLHHDSPGSSNAVSPLFLVNLWIPLQQVTRPLALMDKRTLDRRRHQLRYSLPTEGFLDRPEDRRLNDIWTFLHDPGQRWYFTSDMDTRTAYVFDTLSTPHGAFVLPGEARAELLHQRLGAAIEAMERGDASALRHAVRELEPDAASSMRTPGLQRAIDAMEALLHEARGFAGTPMSSGDGWCRRARCAVDRVIRRSLEMRAVGLMLPSLWPLARRWSSRPHRR